MIFSSYTLVIEDKNCMQHWGTELRIILHTLSKITALKALLNELVCVHSMPTYVKVWQWLALPIPLAKVIDFRASDLLWLKLEKRCYKYE